MLPAFALVTVGAGAYAYSSLTSSLPVSPSAPVLPSSIPVLSPAPASRSQSVFSVSPSSASSFEAIPVRITGVVQYGEDGLVLIEEGERVVRFSLSELGCSQRFRKWTCAYQGRELTF
jgi:hypothetical protein